MIWKELRFYNDTQVKQVKRESRLKVLTSVSYAGGTNNCQNQYTRRHDGRVLLSAGSVLTPENSGSPPNS